MQETLEKTGLQNIPHTDYNSFFSKHSPPLTLNPETFFWLFL